MGGVEYITAEADPPFANLPRRNDCEKPWKLTRAGPGAVVPPKSVVLLEVN